MRVLLTTYGSRGDVEPMVALALALQELDTNVRVCAPPDLTDLLDDAGVPATPVGWPIRALATGQLTDTTPKTIPEKSAELAAMAFEAVTSAGDHDMVVSAGLIGVQAGVQAAAEKLGIPYTGATFSTNFVPSPHHPPVPWPGQTLPDGELDNRKLWDLNAEYLQELFGPPINALRASAGLRPSDNVRDLILGDHPLLASDPVLGPWQATPNLDVTQTGAWTRPDHRPLPDALEAFLESGPPPVYVGFGSMPLHDAEKTGRAALDAVRAHGRRIVLGSGWAELAPDDESDCHIVGEVNQQALFRRVAAVVHHGGAGTTTTTARAGTPQVIVPQLADQPYWGARVTALGIGAAHGGPVPTIDSLSAALDTALSPATAARAMSVADTIRTDGARTAASLLISRLRAPAASPHTRPPGGTPWPR